jgi:hypothetical protein
VPAKEAVKMPTLFFVESKDVLRFLQFTLICVHLRFLFFAFFALFCGYLVFLRLPFAPLA